MIEIVKKPAMATDLTGTKIGRLTVVRFAGIKVRPCGQRHSQWHCLCECGKKVIIPASSLLDGNTRSCGCLGIEMRGIATITHGARRKGAPIVDKKLWKVWCTMKERCYWNKSCSYKDYGRRGILVCDRWMEFSNFRDDLKGTYFKGASLDRIDNNGNYEPKNCRWATRAIQSRNTRRNLILTYNGKTMCIKDWADSLGLNPTTLQRRFHRGLNAEEILGIKS
jgi:hypothetical protein